jgi:rhamnosyltransferase
VLVLMAAYNGATWIEEQVRSILAQQEVELRLTIADDGSSDGTAAVLERLAAEHPAIRLARFERPSGSAAANFTRLLCEAELSNVDWVALADQDDVWLPGKLARACHTLASGEGFDGYSSNVDALFPDGRREPLDKASPQRRHDHYFESPGPGCSFVLSRRLVQALVPVLQRIREGARLFGYHDWFIYAFARRAGFRWTIDPAVTMLYRQHAHNVLGANIGVQSRLRRIETMRSGWYFREVRWQYDTLEACADLMPQGQRTLPSDDLRIDTAGARLRFCWRVAPQARRRLADRMSLAICVLTGIMR